MNNLREVMNIDEKLGDQEVREAVIFGQQGTGTMANIDNQELLPNVDIITTLPALDPTIVRESTVIVNDVVYVAGEVLDLSINYWGQLQGKLGKYNVKGNTWKAIVRELYDHHFTKTNETVVDSKWSIIHGRFTFSKKLEMKSLSRGETFIGFFTEKTSVAKTIAYYEKAVFKGKMINFNRIHNTVDYRVESPHDVYDKQTPEFTKENELEEIRSFIASLRRRVLSNEETELLGSIVSEINISLYNEGLDSYTDEELQMELFNRE